MNCPATMESGAYPGHVHRCADHSHHGDQHWCADCRAWFYTTRAKS